MSWFRWLSLAKSPPKGNPVADSSGLSRREAARPLVSGRARGAKDARAEGGNAQQADRKTERMAQRELLYLVVRSSMVRSGVLTANYKFKVLSLDARGRQFLIMVDLARSCSGPTEVLAKIEALITQSAKARYDIVVTAVYWRMNEHIAVAAAAIGPPRGMNSQPAPLDSRPAALEPPPAAPQAAVVLPRVLKAAPVEAAPSVEAARPVEAAAPAPHSPALAPRGTPRYEPIEADEVAAFKQALAAGIARPPIVTATPAGASATAKAFDGSGKHGPRSYTLLTGFEDTEMPDEGLQMPALSSTQYGDLD